MEKTCPYCNFLLDEKNEQQYRNHIQHQYRIDNICINCGAMILQEKLPTMEEIDNEDEDALTNGWVLIIDAGDGTSPKYFGKNEKGPF